MPRISRLTASILFALPVMLAASAAHAASIEIANDTVIDANHPAFGQRIFVKDGDDGATSVSIIDGAQIEGLAVVGASSVVLDGGTINGRIGGEDDAVVTLRRGHVGCPGLCGQRDGAYASFRGRSKLIVLGGVTIDYSDGLEDILLRDHSQAVFRGFELEKTPITPSAWTVSGVLLDGFRFSTIVEIQGDPTDRLILEVVPEPTSVWLATVGCGFALWKRRGRYSE